MKRFEFKRIFCSFLVIALVSAFVIPALFSAAFAASSDTLKAVVTGEYIYVRSSPTIMAANIVGRYENGYTFPVYANNTKVADGYTWYQCADGWIADSIDVDIVSGDFSSFSLKGYTNSGVADWQHDCIFEDGDYSRAYTIDVGDDGYIVDCRCGWSLKVSCPDLPGYNAAGSLVARQEFCGVDFDFDGIPELVPGDMVLYRYSDLDAPIAFWSCYAVADFGDPLVTVRILDYKGNVLSSFITPISATVSVVSGGPYGCVKIVGQNGQERLYYPACKFQLGNNQDNSFVDGFVTVSGSYSVDYLERNKVFDFVVVPSDLFSGSSDDENIIGSFSRLSSFLVDTVKGLLADLLSLFDNFFGLSDILTDPDYPFYYFTNAGEIFLLQLAQYFKFLQSITYALPSELYMAIFFSFITTFVVLILGWFR